jgi:hypothetical protein
MWIILTVCTLAPGVVALLTFAVCAFFNKRETTVFEKKRQGWIADIDKLLGE